MSLDIFSLNEGSLSIQDDFNKLKETAAGLLDYSKSMVVLNDADYKNATAHWRKTRDFKKFVENLRKNATEPLRKKVSAINELAKELTDPLEQAEEKANENAINYQEVAKNIAKQREIEDAAIWGISPEEFAPSTSKSTVAGKGTTTFTTTRLIVEIIDIKLVPAQFLLVDEDKIKKAHESGMIIPGVNITEEKKVSLRSK